MSAVQRDYIERMIEQVAQAFAQILELVRAGDLDPALILVHRTRDLALGPMRPVLERVDAASAVDLVGKYELDRLRMYAALPGEEGAIHERGGDSARAEQCYLRALDPYALQAAIAACHARARTPEETDWARIAALYDALAQVAASPVVELNRAVAVAMAFGPAAGLELVDRMVSEPALHGYHLLPSVRGDLLAKLGRSREARIEFERAAAITLNERERRLLLERASDVEKR